MVVPIIIGGAIALEELIPLVIAASAVLIYTDQARKKSPTVSRPKPIELPSKSENNAKRRQGELYNYSSNASIDEIVERELHAQSIGLQEAYARITAQDKVALQNATKAAIANLQTCRSKCNCPPDTFKRVRKEDIPRGMSSLSLDYQSAICSSNWYSKKNNNKTKNYITEWVYFKGPGNPPVAFDGWLPRFCLFLEAKARYDHLFKKENGKIVTSSWALSIRDDLMDQAYRQNLVCSTNYPAKCCWVWMTIKAYQYFNNIKRNYPNLYSIYVPLSK